MHFAFIIQHYKHHEHTVHGRSETRHRAAQRQARHLVVSGVGGDAVRRLVLVVHPAARGRARVAAWRAERAARHHQHHHPHQLVGDDGDGVGVVEDEQLGQAPAVLARNVRAGGDLPGQQVLRIQRAPAQRRGPLAQHVLRHLLHDDRPARPAHRRRDDRDGVPARAGREALEEEPGPVCEPHRGDGALLALRRPGVDPVLYLL